MDAEPQIAWTGPLPEQGYVGFVNIRITAEGVVFAVRSEGEGPLQAAYQIPADVAETLLEDALTQVRAARSHS